jgi:hypothetical protein
MRHVGGNEVDPNVGTAAVRKCGNASASGVDAMRVTLRDAEPDMKEAAN